MIEFVITTDLFIFGIAMIIFVLISFVSIIAVIGKSIFSKDFLGYVVAMVVTLFILGLVSWAVS